jgi:hypothetical protein
MVDSIIQKARKIKADFQGFFLFGEKKVPPLSSSLNTTRTVMDVQVFQVDFETKNPK